MAADSEAPSGLKVGQRVSCLGTGKITPTTAQYGSVKYIGCVDGFQGVWVGVDWDNGQARHDGIVNGVRYFDTAEPQSGSFVRPHTLTTGVSLFDALANRYKANPTENTQKDMFILSSVTKVRVPVELVGKTQVEDRQRQLHILKLAALAYAGVSWAGPPGQIKAVASNIEELDLTGHLVSNWHEVKRICDELPKLRILNLSNGRITADPSSSLPVLAKLKALALNNCTISWGQDGQEIAFGCGLRTGVQVEVLKKCLPNIQDLSLCGNKLQSFEEGFNSTDQKGGSTYVQGLETLRLLNLEDNCLESWDEVMKLSQLRSLEQLYLSGNSLHTINFPNTSDSDQFEKSSIVPFEALRCLYLARNKIADWQSVDSLDHFPALQDVRLSDNPLTDSKTGTATRYMLIARIGNLTCLNGSQVRPRERRDSEIRYVRHVLTTAKTKNIEEIATSHPRFEKLRVLHDLPIDTCNSIIGTDPSNNSQKFATTLVSITIVCVASRIGEQAPIIKKLPISTTIGKLKVLCSNLFELQPEQQRLYFKDHDSPLPIPLEDDQETLADVGVYPGRAIILDEIKCT